MNHVCLQGIYVIAHVKREIYRTRKQANIANSIIACPSRDTGKKKPTSCGLNRGTTLAAHLRSLSASAGGCLD